MWLVNKMEIIFCKIGFVDCKCSHLNAPGSYTPWSHSLLGSIVGCPFFCMQENKVVRRRAVSLQDPEGPNAVEVLSGQIEQRKQREPEPEKEPSMKLNH